MFPLRKVVLFKHGVGYYERQKSVEGEASVDFFFKAEQMNDVLKSLTAADLGGGTISSISYQTQSPVEKQLEQLSLHLSKDGFNSLTELLQQTIGAAVLLTIEGDQKVAGRVLGMDEITEPDPENKTALHQVKRLNLLVDGLAIRSIPVLAIRNFVFRDPALRHDLQHLLNILLDMKKKNLKKVTLFTKGQGKRVISASYVIESSVWKTSYRLRLSDDIKKKPHRLEGWCLVDNTGDEDWNAVNLTLVGGRPNAFTLDLYTPRFRKRPVIAVQDEAQPNQPELIDVLPNHSQSFLKDCSPTLSSLDQGGPQIGRVAAEVKTNADKAAERAISSWAKPAEKKETKQMTGLRQVKPVDVFQYEMKNPVSVKRGQSALVPFLASDFVGYPCALFNSGLNPTHPMSCIYFKNSFGTTLDSGPLTIFDDDKCIGEAMVDSVTDDDVKIIAFGVERHLSVKIRPSSHYEPWHESAIGNGVLTTTRYSQVVNTYEFDHSGSLDQQNLFLEHRFQKGKEWSLVDTPLPVTTSENFYRFQLPAKAGVITTFTVREHKLEHNSHNIEYNLHRSTLNSWLEYNFIDKKTHDVLVNDLIPAKDKMDKEREALNKDQNEFNAASSRQSSLYSTLYSLTNSSYSRVVDTTTMQQAKDMIDQETALRKLRVALNEKKLALRQAEIQFRAKIHALQYKGSILRKEDGKGKK